MGNKVVTQALDNLLEDLKATHKGNLAMVVVYGSAATGEYTERRSDYNLLITLHRITPEDLRSAQAPMREWHRLGHPLPVYFTVSELQNAADVFPIEFHQMQSARIVLYGEDLLANLVIHDQHLRHQTEYELRSKLLQLRRLYIPASTSTEKLSDLMTSSLTSFASLFRAALLLQGIEPPITKIECVRLTAQKLKLDATPFERIFALNAKGASKLSEIEADSLFGDYISEIEKVIDFVDNLKKPAV